MIRRHLSLFAALTLVATTAIVSLGASDASQASAPCQLLAGTAKSAALDVASVSLDALAKCGDLTGRTLDYAGHKIAVPAVGTGWTYTASLPAGATGVTEVTIDYYSDRTIGLQVTEAGRSALLGSTSRVAALRSANTAAAAPEAAAAAVSTKCASTKNGKLGWFMINKYSFYINTGGSYPTGAGSRIKDGAATVIGITNQCDVSAATGIDYDYIGTSTKSVQVPSTSGTLCALSGDGYSVHGWGALESAVAATCTWRQGTWVLSSDTKYNSNYSWWTDSATSGCSGKYDVQALATHEIGHSFGLKDLAGTTSASTTQVMYESTTKCKFSNRYLGGGDIKGLKDIYN